MTRKPPPPFEVGDMVREIGGRVTRRVDAVGRDEPFVGYIMVSGVLGWCAATRFEREKEPSARDDLIDGLVTDALDVLHHDRDDDGVVDQHERTALRARFEKRLANWRRVRK